MQKEDILNFIEESKVIAVVRLDASDNAIKVVEAVVKGGVRAIEITLTTPNAYQIIQKLSDNFSDSAIIGAGSVLDLDMARRVIEYGAKYIVSPILIADIVEFANDQEIPVCAGAYTPTEIFNAQQLGADIVKVFPADNLGMKYLKSIKEPMPHLRIMPTGGVSLTNAGEWIKAGAVAVGVGSALIEKQFLLSENYHGITQNAQIIMENVKSIVGKDNTLNTLIRE